MQNQWKQVQARVREQSSFNSLKEALLKEIQLTQINDSGPNSRVHLQLKSKLTLGMLERLLLGDLKTAFEHQFKKPVDFELEVSSAQECFALEPALETQQAPVRFQFKEKMTLNTRLTFDRLISTDENRFAGTVAQGFADVTSPAPYSVLTLNGPAGVGKSHILHAVGLRCKVLNPYTKIKVVTGDEFISDFQMAITKRNMGDFRQRYRLETDLLLIDDLHSIHRAKATQEEFFNLMNHMAGTGRRMVITCDRAIDSMDGLEDRIKSRLRGGLVMTLNQPCEASRIRILSAKLNELGFSLPLSVVTEIARKCGPCVRSLEGMVHLLALNPGQAKMVVEQMRESVKPVTSSEILETVATQHRLSIQDLIGRGRDKLRVAARRICMKRLRTELGLSTSEIGRLLQRDHSTVIAALRC